MNFQTDLKCVCCETNRQRTFHHLITQKSRPELKEMKWNKIPLCLTHHNIIHNLGARLMAIKFPEVRDWLIENEWEFCEFRQKWTHD